MPNQELSDADRKKVEEVLRDHTKVVKPAPRSLSFSLSDVRDADVIFRTGVLGMAGPQSNRYELALALPIGVVVRLIEQPDGFWLASVETANPEHANGTVRLLLSGIPTDNLPIEQCASISGKIRLTAQAPWSHNFGPLEEEFGPNYRGFSWSAVFVPATAPESLTSQTPEGPAAIKSRVMLDPETLAQDIINELRFTSFVPPSRLLDRLLRQGLREEARKQAADRLPDEEALRAFLIACAKEIRAVRRTSAEVTSKSGSQALELDAARLILKMTCQDHVLAGYEADEDLRGPAMWFRLSDDAAMDTAEVASLFSADVVEVSAALNEFHAEVQRRAELV